MTESAEASSTQEQPADGVRQANRVSLWKIGVAMMLLGVVFYLLFILTRAILPGTWEFSIEIDTQVADIVLRPQSETQWRIDGATVCARGELELPAEFRLTSAGSVCGSRAWRGWKIPAPEQVIRLNGGTTATLQSLPDGGYGMSLRAGEDGKLGNLSVVGLFDDVSVGDSLNLIFTAEAKTSRSYPFSGSTTLGRAVTWADTRLLEAGKVAVFTGDESADKRTLVDEAELMLGDQVRLEEPAAGEAWPKGFVRIAPDSGLLQVVAFGRADSLRIERFGNSGYDFRPGWLAKLAADPKIAFWGSLLAGYMTLILSLQPFFGSREPKAEPAGSRWERFLRWFMTEQAD